jgi:hypothetical protein
MLFGELDQEYSSDQAHGCSVVNVPKNGTMIIESQASNVPQRTRGPTTTSLFSRIEVDCKAYGPFRNPESRLSDGDIRRAFRLTGFPIERSQYDAVMEEVECWRGYVRADYMFVSVESLDIVEIKSDRDSFRRFDEQARVFNAIANRVALVVGWNLAARALQLAPPWWEVILAEHNPTVAAGIRFVPLRDGSANRGITARSLAAMLPIGELRRLARSAEEDTGRIHSSELRDVVAECVPYQDLRVALHGWLATLSTKRLD